MVYPPTLICVICLSGCVVCSLALFQPFRPQAKPSTFSPPGRSLEHPKPEHVVGSYAFGRLEGVLSDNQG